MTTVDPRPATEPFAITLEVGSSLLNETGSWRSERPIYVDLLPPCNQGCPAGENVQQWLYRNQQRRQRVLHRVPDHVQIDIEIPVSDPVAHAAHAPPGNLRLSAGKVGVTVHHLGCRFAQHDQAHDHRLLRALVG